MYCVRTEMWYRPSMQIQTSRCPFGCWQEKLTSLLRHHQSAYKSRTSFNTGGISNQDNKQEDQMLNQTLRHHAKAALQCIEFDFLLLSNSARCIHVLHGQNYKILALEAPGANYTCARCSEVPGLVLAKRS